MSISELLVVVIICVLVLKPEDMFNILRKLKELKNQWYDTKQSIISQIESLGDTQDKPLHINDEDMERMNFYLAKITALGQEYQGRYSLEEVRDYYRKISVKGVAPTEGDRSA